MIFWPRLYPELRRFPSEFEAREAFFRSKPPITKNPFKQPKQWIALVGGVVVGWYLMFWHGMLGAVLAPMAIFGIPCLPLIRNGRKERQRFLRQRLNDRGIPICMTCGYDLTGNVNGVCPECGTEIETP